MNFQETVDWARGYILVEIGKGKYEDAVWHAVDRAWRAGYDAAERGRRTGSRRGGPLRDAETKP